MQYVHIFHASNSSFFLKVLYNVTRNDEKHDQFILEFFPKPREMALVPERNFGNRLRLLGMKERRNE